MEGLAKRTVREAILIMAVRVWLIVVPAVVIIVPSQVLLIAAAMLPALVIVLILAALRPIYAVTAAIVGSAALAFLFVLQLMVFVMVGILVVAPMVHVTLTEHKHVSAKILPIIPAGLQQ
jgi:hypothetical protein